MNFFKKLRRPKVSLSISDDTQDKENDRAKVRPLSSNLKRSSGLSNASNYHTSETKLFEEPPCVFSGKEIANNHVKDKQEINAEPNIVFSPVATSPTATESNSTEAGNHENRNHDSVVEAQENQSMSPGEKKTSRQVRLPSSLPDEEEAQEMMTLYASIVRGEKSTVKKLLNDHPQLLEAPDNFGRTPLMYCVLSDRIDCAKLLLKMKANMHEKDKAGRSALHLAAHKGSYKFVELLYEKGANIEMQDNDGQTPLHLITRNRHVRCLEFILRQLQPGMAEVTDNQNRTALHWSAAFNNEESVRLLIKHQCNPAVSDGEGKTPLHWAANTHDPSVVTTLRTLLYSSPSALNWQDYEGRTALHFAVAHENTAAVEFLINFDQEKCEVNRLDNTFRTPLHWAAQLGNSTIVRLLLSVGAKNSISDEYGATPLLYAALHNKHEVVSEMIRHDPNVLEQADIEGRTALMWAAGKGANDVIKLLLGFNSSDGDSTPVAATLSPDSSTSRSVLVDVNRVDNKGNTALHMAAWNGHNTSAQFLLDFGAKHDLLNNMNHTPMFGACEKGHHSVVEGLLDCSANVQLRDLELRTPLHWAAIGGHADVCELLIKTGLDPDVRDNSQRTPLHCAAFGGHINCMNVLLENRADVDLQDQGGMSALHWAAQSGHLDVTKLLFQCSAFPNLMEFTEERLTPLDHALLNGKEEVAQYFIEQGALSSETIRDIAAARIQACYRGYQVRKGFLNRKNLLIQHEMLRSQKDRDRAKKKAMTSSTDQLNAVGEEPPPPPDTSLVANHLPLSSDDVTFDSTTEVNADVITIKSRCDVVKRKFDPTLPDSFHEQEISSLPPCGEKLEDAYPTPVRSLFLIRPSSNHSLNAADDVDPLGKMGSNGDNPKMSGSGMDDQIKSKNKVKEFVRESSFMSDTSAASKTTESEMMARGEKSKNLAAVASADTANSEDGKQLQKRKKKKKHRPPGLPADSTASDLLSAESRKRKRRFRNKRLVQESQTNDCIFTTSNPKPSKKIPIESSSSNLVKALQSPPAPRHSSSSISSSRSTVIRTNPKETGSTSSSSRLRSSLHDLDNIGSDDKIALEPVTGLAYPSSATHLSPTFDRSLADRTNTSIVNENLSLSEYIESLMSLSISERKLLATIQRNRKLAFQQANSAAAIIQSAWRKFFSSHYPDRARQLKKSLAPHKFSCASLPVSGSGKHLPDTPPFAKSSFPQSRSSSFNNVDKSPRKSSSSKDVSRTSSRNSKPGTGSSFTAEENPLASSKKKKKEKRPCTSVSSSPAIHDQDQKNVDPERQDTIPGLIVSDVDSEYLLKTNKVRAKTSHRKTRRRPSNFRPNQNKLRQLSQVYGQTVLLTTEQKRRTGKSLRPQTSRPTLYPDFEDVHFYDPNAYEPMTAVQSYTLDDWKNTDKPCRSVSPSRKSRSRVKLRSTQWKKSYGSGIKSSISQSSKSSTSTATQFSYNMRGSKT